MFYFYFVIFHSIKLIFQNILKCYQAQNFLLRLCKYGNHIQGKAYSLFLITFPIGRFQQFLSCNLCMQGEVRRNFISKDFKFV